MYYVQTQAPSGNWVDSLGTESLDSAKEYACWHVKEVKQAARVIKRADTVVYTAPAPAL